MTIIKRVSSHLSSWKPKLALAAAVSLLAAGCGFSRAETTASSAANTPAYGDSLNQWLDPSAPDVPVDVPEGHELFEWQDLIPSEARETTKSFEKRLAEVERDSPEAVALYEEIRLEAEASGEIVNSSIDGKQIHMAGFVTPLSYEEDFITEFLLVPYFGACIHVPAPPPNQTVMVTLESADGIAIEKTWGPVWITGTLSATSTDTELATTGYSISDAIITPHEDL